MDCQVGSANPDIAGLGIMTSFAFQAGLSILLSICSLALWQPVDTSMRPASQLACGSVHASTTRRASRAEEGEEEDEDDHLNTMLSAIRPRWLAVERATMKKCIDGVLATISDVQVINAMGLLIAALIQRENLSLYHLRVVYDTSSFTGVSVCASLINVSTYAENLKRTRAFALVAYSCTFISFSAVFGTSLTKWDQTVVGCCYNSRLSGPGSYMQPKVDMLYLGLTCSYSMCALLLCYESGLVLPPLARLFKRPFQSDLARRFARKLGNFLQFWRLRETIKWVKILLLVSASDSMYQALRYITGNFALLTRLGTDSRVYTMMVLALIQYPIHLYMIIALRRDNERFLEGDSENNWGFGQIVALVLCAATCIECIRGFSEYRKFVKVERIQPQGILARRQTV